MTKPYKKKLIEVAIPLEAINKASAREKSIRHGHPSTLHLWWARRPLAACRAVLFAQLVDDPSSHPEKFPTEEDQEKERERLFKIMEELVLWENSTNEEVLHKARKEIQASCGGKLPPVYDPFSGGCSIPLEAQRLGLPAYGSDLNPVAVMIGKAMIEIPPKFKDMSPVHPGGPERNHYRYAEGLAEDVRYYGQWMRDRTFERIGHLYPQVKLPKEHGGGHANVIAWIWARTVASPDPAFQGAHVPLVSSFLLSAYKGKEAIVKPIVDKKNRSIKFTISAGPFTAEEINKARLGTKAGKAQDFICLLSGSPVTRAYIREEGKAGRLGVRLVAVVAEGKGGRAYCPPDSTSEAAAASLESDEEIKEAREGFLAGNTPTRATITGGVCSAYGLSTWGKLFSNRQLRILLTLSQLFSDLRREVEKEAVSAGMANDKLPLSNGGAGAKAYADSISIYLSFALSRLADRGSTICSWDSSRTILRNTFGRQGLPMTWDFAEGNPFSNSTGNWSSCCDWVWKVIEKFVPSSTGSVTQQDAQTAEIEQGAVISSDPPYYDNIAYSVLSDFFFSWLRLVLKEIDPSLFGVLETPKSEELVAIPARHGGKEGAEHFFIDGMSKAVGRMAERSSNAEPATIYYAFKQSEIKEEGISSTGWATFLQAVVEAGFAVVGTWPMRTEMTNRMVAAGTNALANSVVLVCRRREIQAEEITRAEFVRALKQELPPALHELQKANITPVDMPQASIGPGIGIFSRYKRVLESDDSPMTVKTALQIINRELDEFLTQQEGEFDVDTRFAVSWFEQNGMEEGSFGDADNLARARGLSVDSVRHAGIVKSAAGKVRLLKRDELERDWSHANDTHLTIWECTQYLIHALENEGEYAAAVLLKKMTPETIDAARDLAYRLHDICSNKRKDAKEATAYNSLIAVWSDLTAQAATISDADLGEGQLSML